MHERKSLAHYLVEAIDRYRAEQLVGVPERTSSTYYSRLHWLGRQMVPNIGTLLLVVVLLLTVPSLAAPRYAPEATSTSTISYQGRLADSAGNPLTGYYNLEFRIYDVPSGGTPLWEEFWTGGNSVQVSDGLFNVMLGSIDNTLASSIEGYDELYLGITVGTDSEMAPRVQLGSVPFSMQALTVPDGSITTSKLDLVDGNVGIGTAGPGAKLEVVSSGSPISRFSGTTANNMRVEIGNASTYMNLGVSSSSSSTPEFPYIWSQSGKFMIGSDGFPTFTVIGMGNGNVGIRTSNPAVALDVNGDFHASGVAEIGVDGQGEGGEIKLASGTTGNDWYIDNRYGTLRAHHGGSAKFTVDPNGNLWASGTKSALVQTETSGMRKLYAAESPEVRFFDEGLAYLKGGVALVELDPVFLDTIEGQYLVHVTPYGDASLYVAEIGPDHFVVKARDGDPEAAFAWRLSAHRKGYRDVRLEQVGE